MGKWDADVVWQLPIGATLWVGSMYAALEVGTADNTAVVTVAHREIIDELQQHCQKYGVEHLCREVDDVPEADILQAARPAVPWIAERLDAGKNVLVHCRAGVSRSVTTCIAYLIVHQNLSVEDALWYIRSTRPFAHPNDGFMDE